MPDLVEQMYCAEQIHIPPTFPFILKQYAKAAIRTQPYDLLRWSAAYFRAMANGDEPPVKQRLEYPPIELPSGLTPGYLKVLLKQFEGQLLVREETLYDRWKGMCLKEDALTDMLNLGRFEEHIDFFKFIAVAAGHLTNSLSQTMILICELLTKEPEGGSAMIPCDTFCNLYSFLARLDCGPVPKQPVPELQEGEVEQIEEEEKHEEEEEEQKEEVTPEEAVIETLKTVTDAAVKIAFDARDSAAEVMEELTDRATIDEARGSVAEVLEELTDTATSVEARKSAAEVLEELTDRATSDEARKSAAEVLEELTDRATIDEARGSAIEVLEELTNRAIGVETREEVSETAVSLVEEEEPKAADKTEAERTAEAIEAAMFAISEVVSTIPTAEQVRAEEIKRRRKLSQFYEVAGIGPVVEEDQIESVVSYMKYWAQRQEGMVMPRNIRHFLCPLLDPIGTVQSLEAEK